MKINTLTELKVIKYYTQFLKIPSFGGINIQYRIYDYNKLILDQLIGP